MSVLRGSKIQQRFDMGLKMPDPSGALQALNILYAFFMFISVCETYETEGPTPKRNWTKFEMNEQVIC
ncbi:hypothetical protein Pyn_17866 [Prunus yedoensis var. nudiflora]|uniref:Uncharacterized protein n=1 Tax=Prunus yedoensis var. nudiflora TaxID=2094558 RepID=A0A314UYT5_PRUYE|nr:hypothetical protein Pyn_06349 [Prunus yedoensis var. nudiflora]PQM42006.1 hypothetical protein Pyn_17866 [Prunus yedoensis var. nudiflora]